ncbi:hypothetical protein ACRAWF_41200 [Streptomyces sp. L7]
MTALAHNWPHPWRELTGHRARGPRDVLVPGRCLAGDLVRSTAPYACGTRPPGRRGAVLEGHGDGIVAVHWSPDRGGCWPPVRGPHGLRGLGPGHRTVRRRARRGHHDTVRDVALSPDGELLATCPGTGRIRIFATAGVAAQVAELAGSTATRYTSWPGLRTGLGLLSAAYDRSYIPWTRRTGGRCGSGTGPRAMAHAVRLDRGRGLAGLRRGADQGDRRRHRPGEVGLSPSAAN